MGSGISGPQGLSSPLSFLIPTKGTSDRAFLHPCTPLVCLSVSAGSICPFLLICLSLLVCLSISLVSLFISAGSISVSSVCPSLVCLFLMICLFISARFVCLSLLVCVYFCLFMSFSVGSVCSSLIVCPSAAMSLHLCLWWSVCPSLLICLSLPSSFCLSSYSRPSSGWEEAGPIPVLGCALLQDVSRMGQHCG